jgi:hypothetical protein
MTHSVLPIQIQGVRVKFSSDLEPLNSFARSHFSERQNTTLPAPGQTAIEAHLEWIEGAPPKRRTNNFSTGKTRVDRDIEVGNGELAWLRIDDFLGLQLCFLLAENRLSLAGQHFFFLSQTSLRDQLKKKWHRNRLPSLRKKRFSTVLYYMIYYPVFFRLERQGLLPLHAAAVDLDGTGVVFCGLPGSGKTTLSLALLCLPEARLLSDNIIFYDKERVFSCPEPVLVDDLSLKLIGNASSVLLPLGTRHVFDRHWCHIDPDRLVDETVPRILLFVGLGAKTTLRPLSCAETYQRFASVNCIAKELRRYLVYRSVLGLLSPESLHREHTDQGIIGGLQQQGRCYELTVSSGDGVKRAIDMVNTLVAAVPR